MRPSFLSQIISGLLILTAFIIGYNNYKQLSEEKDMFKVIGIILLFSLALGVHGIQHSTEEIYYDFNPLEGKWKVKDNR